MDVGEVRLLPAGERHAAPVEPLLEGRLVQAVRQRPREPRRHRPPQALLHRQAGTADAGGDLPVAQPRGLEPQYLSNLAHGQP